MATTLFDALTTPAIQAAFLSWFAAKKFQATPAAALNRVSESIWRAFIHSPQAAPVLAQLPKYDGSCKGKTVPVLGSVPGTVSVPGPDPDPAPVTAGSKAVPPAAILPTIPCTQCGATLPAGKNLSRICNACHLQALAAVADPVADPVQVPVPVPAPVADPVPVPVPVPGTQDPLMAVIASQLQAMGYVPERALTAETVASIALDQAQGLIEQVIADLEAAGKLQTHFKDIIEIRSNDRPVKQIAGKAPKWFPRLVKLAQARVNALLVGPAGCGKTTACSMLAQALDLPFYRVSLSAGVDEGILQGWLLPVGESGRFQYVPSTVVHAYEHGGVVLLDELDAADANMLIILSAVLDNGEWSIPSRYDCPRLERHKDFIIVGAANTFGHGASRKFVGAQQLDERTLSRFRMGQILCDYDPDLEKDLYEAAVVEMGHRLRARCRALPEFGRDVSTRDIETAHAMLSQFSPDEAWYGYFADWSPDEVSRVHAILDHDACTALCA